MANEKLIFEDPGARYIKYRKWNITASGTPYDYDNNGLNKYIMSEKIANSDNPITKYMLLIYEYSIKYVLHYIDELKNFKNVHAKNR